MFGGVICDCYGLVMLAQGLCCCGLTYCHSTFACGCVASRGDVGGGYLWCSSFARLETCGEMPQCGWDGGDSGRIGGAIYTMMWSN